MIWLSRGKNAQNRINQNRFRRQAGERNNMTKRELVKWLESKEQEALNNAEQQYQEAMKLHNEQLYEKIELRKISDEVEGHLVAACKAYEAWEQKHGETVRIIGGYSCGIGCTIKSILNRNGGVFKAMIDYDIADNTPENERMKDKIRTMRKEINRNYENLISNVKNMKNAKLACEYLKEVGFDVSNIEVKEEACTSLAANIDTTYLFIQPTKTDENVN